MGDSIRLAMIGAGGHASKAIYPSFHKLTGGQVVANCDLDPDKARDIGSRHGIQKHYTDWKEMALKERVDGLYVCIGDKMHAKIALEAMEAGYHVYVEKPHAPDLERAKQMVNVSAETGKICMVAYKKRYTPAYMKAKEVIESEAFGRPCQLSVFRSMGGNSQKGPGYLWQWGCHAIDLVDYFFGEADEVCAYRTCTTEDDWRAVTAAIRFPGGQVAQLSLSSPGGNWEEVVVQGERMNAVRVWDGLYTRQHYGNEIVGGTIPSFAAQADGDRLQGFVGELQAFVDHIAAGTQPVSNALSAARTRALYDAIMESVLSGQPARVEKIKEPRISAQ